MLDFSGSEFLVVLLVALIAIGPKQLPEVLYTLGKLFRRMQYIRFALSKQFEDLMEQVDLQEMRKISDDVRMTGVKMRTLVDDEKDSDLLDHTQSVSAPTSSETPIQPPQSPPQSQSSHQTAPKNGSE